MGIVRIASSVIKRKAKKDAVDDNALTRRQSWRRQAGGVKPAWKSLDTGPFNDGQEFDTTRLGAWLQRRQTGFLSRSERWVWQKLDANGFRVTCALSSSDTAPEEVCMEDILGVLCSHALDGAKESEIDCPYERAAYFRRTNLHASEDASDIQSLVTQVEAEYLSQNGQVPKANGKPVALLDEIRLSDREFAILTTKMGFYRGVPLIFRASCAEEKEQWVETLRRLIKFESAGSLAPLSWFAKIRREARGVYTGQITQLIVASLICTNFLVNIIDSQTSGSFVEILEAVDLVFTALFTLELAVNLFATLFAEFFSDPWNYFDSIVVSVGLVTLFLPDLPGGSTLKLMRTFRVFRLFKRIPSLKHLVTSLFKAIPAMANAYVLMMILTSIYAILCVKFFGVLGGEFKELFGDFFGAIFTLWQIMTGDDWSTITRSIMEASGFPGPAALFFISYQLLITFTMVNVVVCVLVDEFCGGGDGGNETSPNDTPPIFCAVTRFKSLNTCRLKSLLADSLACHDIEAFENMMHQIWHSLCRFAEVADPDKEETAITFEELVIGLRELPYCPPVMFKWQDWSELVVRNELCNSHGLLSRTGFYDMVQFAIKRFGKNQLQVAIEAAGDDGWSSDAINHYLYALKAKAICIAENAMRQEEQMLDRQQERNKAAAEPVENARFLNMRKLVWEFNRMHRRFNQVEDMAKRLRIESKPSSFGDQPVLKASTSFTSSSVKGKSKSEDGMVDGVRSGPGSELSAAVTQTQNMPASPPGFASTVFSPIALNSTSTN